MREQKGREYIFWILLSEAVGVLAALLTREGMAWYMAGAVKPPLTPPGWLFPVVWTLLYALMGVGAARVYRAEASSARSGALGTFLLQMVFNFLWSILFFNMERYGAALLWLGALWALVLWMILRFARVDRAAARLQIPYLLWVSFALYLNRGVWMLNR